MRVVVLGANGRLGRLIRPAWTIADTVWQARRPLPGHACQSILEDPRGLADLLTGADAVLCLAGAIPGHDADVRMNVSVARAVLDAAGTESAGHVFLASSAAVYGRARGPLSEDAVVDPVSDYGRSKREMEVVASNHSHPSTCLRIGNVAGADAILGGWEPGFSVDVLPDGTTPRRSYIGPAVLSRTLQALCHLEIPPAVLNVAQPGAVAMGDLLDAAELDWTPRPATSETIADVTLDTRRLRSPVEIPTATAASLVQDWRTSTMTR